ncbi:hypothetical protein [Micromonospora sp. NBC_00421]|uniref:hypothetical protein n=1 Tax=Micromonospora sp. NBC_00421 TaxID=2975976 RepID=UPI002E1ED330
MTATLGQGRDFTAITITDTNRATLTVERNDDGRMSAWIAEPGGNDGHSVLLDEVDAVSVSAYLAGRNTDPMAWLTASRQQAATYANEIGRLKADLERMRAENAARDAVVEAAQVWRAQFYKRDVINFPRRAALIAAVDALPQAVTA